MFPRNLFSTQEEWMKANQDEWFDQLRNIGIEISPMTKYNKYQLTSCIIRRDRKTLEIKIPENYYS